MANIAKQNSIEQFLYDLQTGKMPTSGMGGAYITNSGQQIAFADNIQQRSFPAGQMSGGMGYADSQAQLAAQLPQRASTNSSYSFTLANTVAGAATIIIGAPNIYGFGASATFGNPATVTITAPPNRPFGQFINSLAASPVVVRGIRLICGTNPNDQFSQLNLEVTEQQMTGRRVSDSVQQSLYINSMQQNNTIFDIQSLENKLDGNTYYSFTLLGNTTMSVTLSFASVMDLSKTLQGEVPLTMGNAPLAANTQFVRQIAG